MIKDVSLKVKLLVSILSLVFVFGAVLYLQFHRSLNVQREQIREKFQGYSEKLASNVTQNFYYYYHNV